MVENRDVNSTLLYIFYECAYILLNVIAARICICGSGMCNIRPTDQTWPAKPFFLACVDLQQYDWEVINFLVYPNHRVNGQQ